jgi:hypothetical protein
MSRMEEFRLRAQMTRWSETSDPWFVMMLVQLKKHSKSLKYSNSCWL